MAEGIGAFANNHLSECAHAFLEALTEQTEVLLVGFVLVLEFGSGTISAFLRFTWKTNSRCINYKYM